MSQITKPDESVTQVPGDEADKETSDTPREGKTADMEDLIRKCNQSIVDSQAALTKYDEVQEEIQGARISVIGGISRMQRPSGRWRRPTRDDYTDEPNVKRAEPIAHSTPNVTNDGQERDENPMVIQKFTSVRDKSPLRRALIRNCGESVLSGRLISQGNRDSSPVAKILSRKERDQSPVARVLSQSNREASQTTPFEKRHDRDQSPMDGASLRREKDQSPMDRASLRQERDQSPMARASLRQERDQSPMARASLRKERDQSPMARASLRQERDQSPNRAHVERLYQEGNRKYIVPPIILNPRHSKRLDYSNGSSDEENTLDAAGGKGERPKEQHMSSEALSGDPARKPSSYAEIIMPSLPTLQEKLRYRMELLEDDDIPLKTSLTLQERLLYRLALLGEDDDDALMPSSLTLRERLRYRLSLFEDDLDDEAWSRIASRLIDTDKPDTITPISTTDGEKLYYRMSALDREPRGLFSHAAKNGDLALVQALVMEGVDVNAVDGDGMSALHHSVVQSQFAVAKFLLSLKCTMVNKADLLGKTPLHYAVEKGHTPALVSLLLHGAYANSTDIQKQTPLHKACRDGKHNIVDILLENGASIFAFDDTMKAPLHNAVENNHPACVTALIKKGAPVNSSDGNQRTPLHYAAQFGFFLIADILLANGATVDSLDKDMKSPLFIAVQNNFISMTRTLISYNASVNSADMERLTPLHVAAVNGSTELVVLLLQHGANVDAADCADRTPISYAVENNEVEVVQILLQNDASVAITDIQSMTPLHYAAEIGDEFLVHLLADYELKHSSNDTTYKRLFDIAFKYQNELLGSMTMNHALKGYSEIIQQENQTEKNKEEATSLMKSLLTMVCKHFSHYHGEKLVRVWPGYKEMIEDCPVIVVNVTSLPKVKPSAFMGLPIVYKLYGLVSDEAIMLSYSKLEIEKLTDPLEIMVIQRIINRNIARLKLDHSNLVKVSASAIRSLQNGNLLAKEACIVLYCRCKGIIPFGEKPFPKQVDGIPVDVRDGLAGDLEGLESRIKVGKLNRELLDASRSSDEGSRKKLEF